MKKKKKKFNPVPVNDNTFEPDLLVEGDCPAYSTLRVFTAKNESVTYSFREHFLYFPWENKKSKFYSTECPPASFHLEKRPDLKSFNFFQFRKQTSKVNLYRFSLEKKLCDDLLEYISDNVESKARELFQQKITELRESKRLSITKPTTPIIYKHPSITECHFIHLQLGNRPFSKSSQHTFSEFESWFNNLNDNLVDELNSKDKFLSVTEEISSLNDLLIKDNISLVYTKEDESLCVHRLISTILKKWFSTHNTKFKFAICASPGFGKTYLRNLFVGYNIVDLDDISMLDPVEGPLLHKLVNNRDWNQQRLEYHRIIRTKFKEGILLAQNSGQLPPEIPFVNVLTPGHLNRKKLWSDRGLFDLITGKNRTNKIFISEKSFRNKLVQIIFDEIYKSDNFKY